MWPTIQRDEYLRMADRHLPFWGALVKFVSANKIASVIELGCGVAHLSHLVDQYTGIDTNGEVLRANESFYGHGTWISSDWRNLDPKSLRADLFVASSVIEHCEAFEPLLKWVISLPVLYSVVTFHKGLQDSENIRRDKVPPFFDNFYCRADVERWMRNVDCEWRLYDLPLSRTHLRRRRDSVLVIYRNRKADLSMWLRRAVNVAS